MDISHISSSVGGHLGCFLALVVKMLPLCSCVADVFSCAVMPDRTLCDPMGRSPPVSSVHGIFQAGILDQVAIFHYELSFTGSPVNMYLH